MTVLRFLSALFFLIALVAFAADATPWLSGNIGIHASSSLQRWGDIAPSSLSAAQDYLTSNGFASTWTSVIAPVLSMPAFALFGALALVLGYAGRRRRSISVFIN